ncbi:hypothetical protein Naga_100572g2 [Nannochloropsis gaditana]|uniref:Uncharacterized protein n=1 Tax=Nannochloropsis gaditana TaxID=72520 RepID=W7TYU6_9STRA|nr:hypothetical protein Naga_100572g2 [Nannochloropsis gaditana]
MASEVNAYLAGLSGAETSWFTFLTAFANLPPSQRPSDVRLRLLHRVYKDLSSKTSWEDVRIVWRDICDSGSWKHTPFYEGGAFFVEGIFTRRPRESREAAVAEAKKKLVKKKKANFKKMLKKKKEERKLKREKRIAEEKMKQTEAQYVEKGEDEAGEVKEDMEKEGNAEELGEDEIRKILEECGNEDAADECGRIGGMKRPRPTQEEGKEAKAEMVEQGGKKRVEVEDDDDDEGNGTEEDPQEKEDEEKEDKGTRQEGLTEERGLSRPRNGSDGQGETGTGQEEVEEEVGREDGHDKDVRRVEGQRGSDGEGWTAMEMEEGEEDGKEEEVPGSSSRDHPVEQKPHTSLSLAMVGVTLSPTGSTDTTRDPLAAAGGGENLLAAEGDEASRAGVPRGGRPTEVGIDSSFPSTHVPAKGNGALTPTPVCETAVPATPQTASATAAGPSLAMTYQSSASRADAYCDRPAGAIPAPAQGARSPLSSQPAEPPTFPPSLAPSLPPSLPSCPPPEGIGVDGTGLATEAQTGAEHTAIMSQLNASPSSRDPSSTTPASSRPSQSAQKRAKKAGTSLPSFPPALSPSSPAPSMTPLLPPVPAAVFPLAFNESLDAGKLVALAAYAAGLRGRSGEGDGRENISVPPLLIALCNEVEIIYQEVRLGLAEPTDKEAKLRKSVQAVRK